MRRRDVYWLGRPAEDNEERNLQSDYRAMCIRLVEDWCAVDADQLILPIALVWRIEDDGVAADYEGSAGLLKQYGGESLLNDLLLDPTVPEPGSRWIVEYYPASGFTISSEDEWEPPLGWVEDELERIEQLD